MGWSLRGVRNCPHNVAVQLNRQPYKILQACRGTTRKPNRLTVKREPDSRKRRVSALQRPHLAVALLSNWRARSLKHYRFLSAGSKLRVCLLHLRQTRSVRSLHALQYRSSLYGIVQDVSSGYSGPLNRATLEVPSSAPSRPLQKCS